MRFITKFCKGINYLSLLGDILIKKLSLHKNIVMNKLIRTIIIYLLSIALQIVSFLLSKNKVEVYNKRVEQHNASIVPPTLWERIIGKKPVPEQSVFDSSLGWFTIDKWENFDIKYYNTTELISFVVLFTITALTYIFLSGEMVSKNYPILRVVTFILSLLSGYVIFYEIIAIITVYI